MDAVTHFTSDAVVIDADAVGASIASFAIAVADAWKVSGGNSRILLRISQARPRNHILEGPRVMGVMRGSSRYSIM